MSAIKVADRADASRFAVRVKLRSSRSRVESVHADGSLIVVLNAPPVDGKANAELLDVLARAFGVKKFALQIVSGRNGRRKIVDVQGVSPATIAARVGDR